MERRALDPEIKAPLPLVLGFLLVGCRGVSAGPADPEPGPAPASFAPGENPTPAQEAGGGRVQVLALEQETTGLPEKPDLPTFQKLLIDEKGGRVLLYLYGTMLSPPQSPRGGTLPPPKAAGAGSPALEAGREAERRVLLRLDLEPPEIYEIWDRERAYRKTARDLISIQEERDRVEADELRRLPLMSAADRKAFLEENHLRPDGRRSVEVARGERKQILSYQCEEVKVFENGRQVVRAWITREAAGARSFFNLYRRLGAFSREVLEKVAGMEGLPLEADITVVTAAPAYRISARCLSVKTEEVPRSEFEVPPGYKEKKTELPPIVECSSCGKKLERREAGARYSPPEGDLLFFCSQDHRKEYLDERDKLKKKAESAESKRR